MSEQITIPISKRVYDRAQRLAALRRRDVQEVIEQALEYAITTELSAEEKGWDMLMAAVERSKMDAGVSDLADQHDHYLYGVPKQGITDE